MAIKFIKKLTDRSTKYEQSIIQPNASLNVENRSKYAQMIPNKDNSGYKGLKRAFTNEIPVEIIISVEDNQTQSIKGIISHYDEKYEQLLVVVDASLKRVVFNQIVEVHIEEPAE